MGIWKCGSTGLSHQIEGDKERYRYRAIGVFLLPITLTDLSILCPLNDRRHLDVL